MVALNNALSFRLLFFDQSIEFGAELAKDFLVGEGAQGFTSSLEIDSVGTAPESEIGVVGFAWPVDSAAHHGDRDLVRLGVTSHLANLLGQFNERFVLDS
jgi:hypothetical protein